MRLSAENKVKLVGLLLADVDTRSGDTDASRRAWQAELTRRIAEVQSGRAATYTLEETMAFVRQSLAERTVR